MTQLKEATGGLSNPSKMPGYAYGIPASECIVGSILRKKIGSVCSKCYAHKGMYSFPVVKEAQARRLERLRRLESWIPAMIELIGKKSKKVPFFRWHDAGDFQSLEHMSAVANICRQLPKVNFWIPTKESGMLKKWLDKGNTFSSNVAVRLSAPMIGETRPHSLPGILSSTVGTGKGFQCGAYKRGGECGDCRACWDIFVNSIDYPLH